MHLILRRMRSDERGSALITALIATVLMLGLGLALLSIVDTQANVSANERTRDRGFNLAESVLSSQSFVLGRNWPATQPTPNPAHCSDLGAGFGDTLGSAAATVPAVARLRKSLNAAYTDTAYAGGTWQVNLCDDVAGSTVWNSSVLDNRIWDANGNKRMWVVAQSTLGTEKRSLVGLVLVRENQVLPSKYGLVSGALTDDLGGTVNTLATSAIGGVLGGLLNSTPAVARDPAVAVTTPPSSGVTGVRCGATDVVLIPLSTCVAGTVGALSTLPLVSNVLTGGNLTHFPTTSTATAANIDQLRAQAIAAGTYSATSLGGVDETTTQACQLTGTLTTSSIVFIEKVGNGDQFCVLNVPVAGLAYRAVVVGSGRIIIRGAAITGGAPVTTSSRTFSGVVYALNRQRLTVAEGGQGLGDSAAPGREVVRIERGAHVKGGVYADGRGAKVGIHPPLAVDNQALKDQLCASNLVACLLGGITGLVGNLLDLVGGLTNIFGLNAVLGGITNQLNPQRTTYGSAIVSDVNAVNSLTAYGASGVIPGSFRDLNGR